eukprot:2436855-Pyramimonas_sp.AAC.1
MKPSALHRDFEARQRSLAPERPSCRGARPGPSTLRSFERSPVCPSAEPFFGPSGGAALSSRASKPPTHRAFLGQPERAVRWRTHFATTGAQSSSASRSTKR